MSPIISISVDREFERDIDSAMRRLSCSSRSKLFRIAIASLLKEQDSLETAKGEKKAVVMMRYNAGEEGSDEILHKFSGIVKSSTHIHSGAGCSEILVLEGESGKIRSLVGGLRKLKPLRSISCELV